MALREELLLGKIAVEQGLLTKEQLDKAIAMQEKEVRHVPLGTLLVDKGFLKREGLERLLAVQKERFQEKAPYSEARLENILFGRLVVHLGLATRDQVNECLRIQAKVEDEVDVRLGEILVKKGYLSKDVVKKLLSIQNKRILHCRKCSDQVNVVGYSSENVYTCPHCGAPLAPLAEPQTVDVRGTVMITKEMHAKLMSDVAEERKDDE